MTKPENISWLALGLIVALVILAFATAPRVEASAATAMTTAQPASKAICRKCQRPPAPS